MKLNYKKLGKYIRQVDIRNKDLRIERLLGVSIKKVFIESIANTVGTDFSNYKVVKREQFAYGPVTSRNGDKISVALLEEEECIISSSYSVFEVIDENMLLPEYLMLWFRREEFDRYSRFMSHGSVREIFDWEQLCNVELPVPEIEKQKAIVQAYKIITDRIILKQQINDDLEDTALSIYRDFISDISEDDTETIYNVLTVINGAAFSSDVFNSEGIGYPLVRIRDLSSCNPDVYTDEQLAKIEYVNAGDILIGMDGEFIPHIWHGAVGVLNQRVCKVIPTKKCIHPMFLYITLKPILAEIQRTQGGTTVIHIGKKDFDNMSCVTLNEEQHKELSSRLSPLYNLMLNNAKETRVLFQMKEVILSELSR